VDLSHPVKTEMIPSWDSFVTWSEKLSSSPARKRLPPKEQFRYISNMFYLEQDYLKSSTLTEDHNLCPTFGRNFGKLWVLRWHCQPLIIPTPIHMWNAKIRPFWKTSAVMSMPDKTIGKSVYPYMSLLITTHIILT
jgi:predicted amidophosphoribosyltransferase